MIAEQVLSGEEPQLLHFGIADDEAWDVGLPCGGEIDVWVQAYEPGRFEEIARVRRARRRGDDARGRRRPVRSCSSRPTARARARSARPSSTTRPRAPRASCCGPRTPSAATALFIDVVDPAPRLILFGAVDVAASLCTLARAAGWRPYVVDPRARFATPERFPDAEEVIVAWPEEAFARLGGIDPATSIAVLTHDPKLDDAALEIALRSPARFVGAMGSRRAQAARRERLLAAGLGEEELARLAAPLGLDLGARQRRGDRAVDPGRGRRRAARPRRRPARARARPDPRGDRVIAGLVLAAGAGTRFGVGLEAARRARRAPAARARDPRPVRGRRARAGRGRARFPRRRDPASGSVRPCRTRGLSRLGRWAVGVAAVRRPRRWRARRR